MWLPHWSQQRIAFDDRPGPEDPLADLEALQQLATWCQQFSPTVGLEDAACPESLLLEMTGMHRLFGDETALVRHVAGQFSERGLTARMALADTLGAAWAVAHFGLAREESTSPAQRAKGRESMVSWRVVASGQTREALKSLPVESLRLSAEAVQLLKELGLFRVGQLLGIGRDGLASRFGMQLPRRLDQAIGEAEEVLNPEQIPVEARAGCSLEHPTERFEVLESILFQLLEQVVSTLIEFRHGVRQLECRLQTELGTTERVPLGMFRPSGSSRHLWELLRLRLEKLSLREPISACEILVLESAPLECRQRELFTVGSGRHNPYELALLVDRLSSRLGRECVVRAKLLPDAQPEYGWYYAPLIDLQTRRRSSSPRRGPRKKGSSQKSPSQKNSRRKTTPARAQASGEHAGALHLSRPLRLLFPPEPLAATSVVPDGPPLIFHLRGTEYRLGRTWGPERIETGWWREARVRRDYYRVETTQGAWFWLFRRREDGQWFLHGEFD